MGSFESEGPYVWSAYTIVASDACDGCFDLCINSRHIIASPQVSAITPSRAVWYLENWFTDGFNNSGTRWNTSESCDSPPSDTLASEDQLLRYLTAIERSNSRHAGEGNAIVFQKPWGSHAPTALIAFVLHTRRPSNLSDHITCKLLSIN